jgi:hypothetical protein
MSFILVKKIASKDVNSKYKYLAAYLVPQWSLLHFATLCYVPEFICVFPFEFNLASNK